MQRTVTRQMSFDLSKLLVTEDWFSDISPQTMRRLLNIVSVTGGSHRHTQSRHKHTQSHADRQMRALTHTHTQ